MSSITTTNYRSCEHLDQGFVDKPPDNSHFENIKPIVDKNNCFKTVQTKLLRFGTHLKKLKLEMVAFLFTFSYVLTKITSTTMILDKVCLVNFNYPPSICFNLENHTEIKASAERLAINYQLGHTLIQTVPAALLACFIGPWSDHYGRKFPILLAIFGMILDAIGSMVCAYFLDTRVEYYFIPAAFTGVFGGPVSILAVVYSYASDSTPLSKRTMKYAFLELAAGFAIPFGATAGGWVYEFFGYPAVFFLSAGGLCLSFVWVTFLMDETRGLDNKDSWPTKLRNMFSCQSFKESFIATAKHRPHQGRQQILLLIFSMCFIVITSNSTGDINYLYVHHQFGWGNATYSTITAIYTILAIFLLVIVIPILKYFKVGDPVLGLIGTVSLLGKKIGMGLSTEQGVYHFANLFGLLGGLAALAARSRISKVVSNEDLGKVFSFVATAESLLPILASVLITQIFNASLETFPGLPYITLAIFLLLPLGVFSWICCLPKMSYEDIDHTIPQNKEIFHTSV